MPHASIDNLDLRSEEVQEVLSFIPSWIVRWGITVLLFVVIALFVLAWVVRYPDVLPAKIVIVTQNPPVHLLTRSAGKLMTLNVADKTTVKADSILAVLENSALTADVVLVASQIRTLQTALLQNATETILQTSLPANLHLGDIQADYGMFVQNLNEYTSFHQIFKRYFDNRIGAFSKQLVSYSELNAKLSKQQEIAKREEEMARRKFDSDKVLFQKKYMSEVEINASESAFLSKRSAVENAGSALVNNSIQIANLERTVLDLKQQREERERSTALALQEALNRLDISIKNWQQRYCIVAPVDGTVSLTKYWAVNQYVAMGDEMATVIPGEQTMIGKIMMPVAGSGKVKVGQRTNIKFDSYPFQEFGSVDAVIESISLVPNNNQYIVTVALPNGLTTSYKKSLTFQQEMQGNAEIITEDLRILERIFNQFRYIFSNAVR
jgi:HlyD family secretion protein